jgi:DNA-binding CsgD family transcriptional regulator
MDLGNLSPAAASLGYELGTVTSRQDFLHAAAQTLLSLIGGDVIGWNSVDVAAGRVEVACFPDDALDEKIITDRLRETTDDNPMIVSYLRTRADLLPRRLSDVCTHRDLIRTRTYAELLRPTAANHQLTILTGRILPISGRCWAINRSGSDFADREIDLATRLQPLLWVLDHTRELLSNRSSDRDEDMAARLRLTTRELEVLRYVGGGLTADAIGHLLRISGRTVRKHLENTYRKLGCHDRLIAVQHARTLGLLDDIPAPSGAAPAAPGPIRTL